MNYWNPPLVSTPFGGFDNKPKPQCWWPPLVSSPFSGQMFWHSKDSEFFREGSEACKTNKKQLAIDIFEEKFQKRVYDEFQCCDPECEETFTCTYEFETHYLTAHEISCMKCRKTFPSHRLLEIHIEDGHAVVVPVKYSCVVMDCKERFFSIEDRNTHIFNIHKYPRDFRFEREPVLEVVKYNPLPRKLDQVTILYDKASKKVPKDFCFGRDAERGFVQQNGARRSDNSSGITMTELSDAIQECGL